MEMSIETIWKEGFLKSDALVAPKINDLYNQKSKNIIDKFKRMFTINLAAIIAGAFIILAVSIFEGFPYAGTVLFLLLATLVIVGKRELNRLEKIDKGASSYQYLKAFDEWLKEVISIYTIIYRIFYPAIFITVITGVWFSSFGESLMQKILMKYPDIYLVNGLPVYWMLGALLIACLLGFFAGAIYKKDMDLLYGNLFKKLDEIITDMEELRG